MLLKPEELKQLNTRIQAASPLSGIQIQPEMLNSLRVAQGEFLVRDPQNLSIEEFRNFLDISIILYHHPISHLELSTLYSSMPEQLLTLEDDYQTGCLILCHSVIYAARTYFGTNILEK